MTKKTSYSFIIALAVISLLFFAPKGAFAADVRGTVTIVSGVATFTAPAGISWHDTGGTGNMHGYTGAYPSTASPSAPNIGFGTGYYYDVCRLFTDAFTYNPSGCISSSQASIPLDSLLGSTDGTYWLKITYSGWSDSPVYYDFSRTAGVWSVTLPPPPTTQITAISPQTTDPFTQTATTSVSYYITPADLAAGTTTLSYVITTQDSIGYNPAQIGTITATSSGSFTNTFYMGTGQAMWSAYYTLSGVAGEDPNIGAFFSISTSTVFVNGTSTLLNITSATSTGTTTNGLSLQQCKSTSLVDFSYFACVIGNRFSDVFQWLFIPPQGSLNEYQNMKTTVETKAPFGYFFLIKNAISGVNASSTSTFTLTLDQGVLAGIITPIRTALSWILLMGFGFWFYMRMKHLDIW